MIPPFPQPSRSGEEVRGVGKWKSVSNKRFCNGDRTSTVSLSLSISISIYIYTHIHTLYTYMHIHTYMSAYDIFMSHVHTRIYAHLHLCVDIHAWKEDFTPFMDSHQWCVMLADLFKPGYSGICYGPHINKIILITPKCYWRPSVFLSFPFDVVIFYWILFRDELCFKYSIV